MKCTTVWKYRRVPRRDDIQEIKQRATTDSVHTKEIDDNWSTLYNGTYIKHPIGYIGCGKGIQGGLHIGGGNFSPNENELSTCYRNSYKPFSVKDVPPIAKGPPPSDIITGEEPIPESTCHAALKEANEGRPPYDNSEALERAAESRSSHFYFGDKFGLTPDERFKTIYNVDYIARENDSPVVIDNSLQKSSIEFDAGAGLGPHTKAMSKRNKSVNQVLDPKRLNMTDKNFDLGYDDPDYITTAGSATATRYPKGPDTRPMNMSKRNFDVGYENPDYSTSTGLATRRSKFAARPESFKAPPCAELSDHGDQAGKWQTTYSTDFVNREPIPNVIDQSELKATHWDQGYDKAEWPQPQPVHNVRPERNNSNMHESNVVFFGDYKGRYKTTSKDLTGNFDPSMDGRAQMVDARGGNLFLGCENPTYISTAKDANRLAGTGKPAEISEDLHLKRGASFATGGTFDPHYGGSSVDEKPYVDGGAAEKIDSRYFTQSHFMLDASSTVNNKPRGYYKTTYWQDYCKPTIAK